MMGIPTVSLREPVRIASDAEPVGSSSIHLLHSGVLRPLGSLATPWWRWWDSNPWPPACRAGALPAELHPHFLNEFRFSPIFQDLGTVLSVPPSCVSIELSSRTVARKVFSPLQSLTSVFGMGTGGPSAFVTLTFFKDTWSLKIEQHLISREISLSFDTRQSSFLFFHELHSITSRYTVRSP